jgi:hypothetical protein
VISGGKSDRDDVDDFLETDEVVGIAGVERHAGLEVPAAWGVTPTNPTTSASVKP